MQRHSFFEPSPNISLLRLASKIFCKAKEDIVGMQKISLLIYRTRSEFYFNIVISVI